MLDRLEETDLKREGLSCKVMRYKWESGKVGEIALQAEEGGDGSQRWRG